MSTRIQWFSWDPSRDRNQSMTSNRIFPRELEFMSAFHALEYEERRKIFLVRDLSIANNFFPAPLRDSPASLITRIAKPHLFGVAEHRRMS